MDTPVNLPCAAERIICIVRQPGPLDIVADILKAVSTEPGARLILSQCGKWLTVIRPEPAPAQIPENPVV